MAVSQLLLSLRSNVMKVLTFFSQSHRALTATKARHVQDTLCTEDAIQVGAVKISTLLAADIGDQSCEETHCFF